MSKSIFQSKTFWINAATLAVTVLTALTNSDLVSQYPQLSLGIGAALAALNIAIRFLTTVPVSIT